MVSRIFSNFLRNRVSELSGMLAIVLASFLLLSFISYDPYDPSLNFVTNAQVKNLGGILGAYFAAPVLEIIGIAVFVPIIALLAWGLQFIRKSNLTNMWLKITLLVICIPAMSSALTLFDNIMVLPSKWPSESFGGFLGIYTKNYTTPLIDESWFYGITICIAVVTLFISSGLTILQSKKAVIALYKSIIVVVTSTLLFTKKAYGLLLMQDAAEIKAKKKKVKKRRIIDKKEKVTADKPEPLQASFDLNMHDNYQMPPISLLKTPTKKQKSNMTESSLSQNAELLEKVLDDFGIKGTILEVRPGPVVTQYVLEPSPGTKSSRVIGLADDIARSMSAVSARIDIIPGRNAIGIELPNSTRETVFFKEIIDTPEYQETKHVLPLALGKTIDGEAIIIDLAKTPHLLVAGTTGSGKSVGINAMILSLLYKYSPNECKFIMVDPKMLELSVYEGIPHLLTPVVTEPGKAVVALKWTVKEMENRYRLMSNLGVRNIQNYNEKIKEAVASDKELTRSVQTGFDPDSGKPIIETVALDMNPLPFIVVIVDEMADLMLVGGKEIEISVQRLAQMARAAGIHIILSTQRPSVDVITGVIKANFPTRISFQVTSKIDSRTILGEQGAEQLLGMGDMLYMAGGSKVTRIHGPFVDDKEVEEIANFIRKQGKPSYIEEIIEEEEESLFDEEIIKDALYEKAVAAVYQKGQASTSFVQRALRIGYNRAANIIEMMEKEGVVSKADHVGRREVIGSGA